MTRRRAHRRVDHRVNRRACGRALVAAAVAIATVGIVSGAANAERHGTPGPRWGDKQVTHRARWAPTAKPTSRAKPRPTAKPTPRPTAKATPTAKPTPTPTPATAKPAATSCGGPITISTGGTYSGCYQSTSASTPAVTIATTAAVTLSHAHVIEVGNGVADSVRGVDLTIRDTVFDQTDPGTPVEHRAVILDRGPTGYVSEHNRFNDTDGQWLGGGSTISGLSVRDNLAFDIGRYPHPAGGNCCVQFLQLDHETVPSGMIQYNHTQNISGQSGVEDNINMYFSGGSSSDAMLDISHNLIDGAYPTSPRDHQFTGGGIMAVDGGGATSAGHVTVHDNTVVSTTNYGVACAGGQDCHISGNVTINDRFGSDGSTLYDSDFGQAYSMHDTTRSAVTGGSYNWTRDANDRQQSCWMPPLCSGLVHVSTTEEQARANWTDSLPSAELPIGPRP